MFATVNGRDDQREQGARRRSRSRRARRCGRSAWSRATPRGTSRRRSRIRGSDPAVVVRLEPLEDRCEQTGRIDGVAPSSASDVAGVSASAGNCASVCETFTPMPSTTRPSTASARIPATLRPPTSTSFGCLTVVRRPVSDVDRLRDCRAGDERELGSRAGGTGGSSTIEKSRLVPAGACHVRPSRPRPSVCSPVAATAPSGAPSSSRCVDAHRSTNVNGRPKRPRSRGDDVACRTTLGARDRVGALRAGDNRADPPPPPPLSAPGRGRRARAGHARGRAQARDGRGLRRPLSRATRSCRA